MIFAMIILVILLTLAYFYLKCSILASFSTMMMLIITSIISFTYYEKLADFFISQGYGNQWAHVGCFVLIFILAFVLLRTLSDFLIGGASIDLGNPAKISFAIVCGLISGLIISGNILVAMGLAPVQNKFLYNRFKSDSVVALITPQKTFLNADGFITGLYSLVSRGSMASGKSFAVLHADFLPQIHLNRLKIKDGILPIASKDCLEIPSGNVKKPVRIRDIPDHGKATVVRVGILAHDIESGGAGNPAHENEVEFFPAQIRMICKDDPTEPLAGAGKAVYPIGFLKDGELIKTLQVELVGDDVRTVKNRVIWLDVVFDVPENHEGVLFEFKQNALVELPAAVPSSEEIERALDGQGDGAES